MTPYLLNVGTKVWGFLRIVGGRYLPYILLKKDNTGSREVEEEGEGAGERRTEGYHHLGGSIIYSLLLVLAFLQALHQGNYTKVLEIRV